MIIRNKIDDLQCIYVKSTAADSIAYMIYPLMNGFSDEWLESQADKNHCAIVLVYVPLEKWNDYLTPWPEPGETPKAEPFAGHGESFLKKLQDKVIPDAENALAISGDITRNLVGVSLSGLFTLWQWMLCDTFHSISCLSGSFWYAGFLDWFDKLSIPNKTGKAFFLLGTDEPNSRIKAYRTVGVNTEEIVKQLSESGIDATFTPVPGNHFANPLDRATMGLSHICQ